MHSPTERLLAQKRHEDFLERCRKRTELIKKLKGKLTNRPNSTHGITVNPPKTHLSFRDLTSLGFEIDMEKIPEAMSASEIDAWVRREMIWFIAHYEELNRGVSIVGEAPSEVKQILDGSKQAVETELA